MAARLTTAGSTHIAELAAGTTPTTNAFDGILFGQGNDDPNDTPTETQADLTSQLTDVTRQLSAGYPKLGGDGDTRNKGSQPTWWTWKFEVPAGEAFVASNVALVNYAGATFTPTDPIAIHSDQVIAQRYDERLIVWFNALTGEVPVVSTATEQSLENRVSRAVGFTAQARALTSYPNGSNIDDMTVRTRPQPGQYVWTGAQIPGVDGTTLRADQVGSFVLDVFEWKAGEDRYERADTIGIDPARNVFPVDQFGDQRWNGQGGYNVAHEWAPPFNALEGTYRLTYQMELTDGDVRRWVNLVEIRRGAV